MTDDMLEAFRETLINTLRFDEDYKKKGNVLIPILSRSQIHNVPQYDFVRGSGRMSQRYEDIEIRVPTPLLPEAKEYNGTLRNLVQYVYEDSKDYGLGKVLIKPLIMLTPEELKEHNVVFSDIQNTVIQGIRDAKYLIWAAVAWFTNEAIFRELLLKRQAGLDVRVVISDEESNSRLLNSLKENFDVVVIPRHGIYDWNRMHDKFCIIDLEYVMHGSYNWTTTADYNEETLATAVDKEFVKKFADEFMRLYQEYHK